MPSPLQCLTKAPGLLLYDGRCYIGIRLLQFCNATKATIRPMSTPNRKTPVYCHVDAQSIFMCIIKITGDCQIGHHMQENKGSYLFEVINNSKLFQQLSYVNQ